MENQSKGTPSTTDYSTKSIKSQEKIHCDELEHFILALNVLLNGSMLGIDNVNVL